MGDHLFLDAGVPCAVPHQPLGRLHGDDGLCHLKSRLLLSRLLASRRMAETSLGDVPFHLLKLCTRVAIVNLDVLWRAFAEDLVIDAVVDLVVKAMYNRNIGEVCAVMALIGVLGD